MSLTNEQIEEKINKQSEQIARIDHDLKEVISKVNNQSEQINKIDDILENQKQSTQQINDLEKRMIGIEGTLKSIESTLKLQESYIQKIPELSEKVGELKNWRQIFIILITALITWYFRGVNLKP